MANRAAQSAIGTTRGMMLSATHTVVRAAKRSASTVLRSGTFWIAAESAASRGTLLVALSAAAHILGAAEFGEFIAVQSTIALLSAFVGDALRVTAAKHIAAANQGDRGRMIGLVTTTGLLAGTALFALLLSLSPFISRSVMTLPDLENALRLGAIILFLEALGGIQVGILIGLKRFRAQALSGFAGGAATLPSVIMGAYFGGVIGTLIGLIVAYSLASILRIGFIVRAITNSRLHVPFRVDSDGSKILWHFSLPAVLTSLTWAPVNWFGMTLLANADGGYTELGVVGAAMQWFSLLLFLPNVFANVLLPSLAHAASIGDTDQLSLSLRRAARLYVMVVLPAAVAIALKSSYIMSAYGAEYSTGGATLAIIALASIPASALNVLSYLLAAADKMWSSLYSGCVFAITYVLVAIAGTHAGIGANAIALSMLAAYTVKLIAQSHSAIKVYRSLRARTSQ